MAAAGSNACPCTCEYIYTYIGVQADGNPDLAPLVCRPPAPVAALASIHFIIHAWQPPSPCLPTHNDRHARTHVTRTRTHIHIYFLYVYLHAYMYICICMSVYIYVSSAMRWCAMSYKHTGRRALTGTRTRANISVGGCTVGAGGCTVAVNIYTYI